MPDSLVILDFGSQYTQLIARRIREMQVYCEIFPWDSSAEQVMKLNPGGIILSGGPASVYEKNAPTLPDFVIQAGVPILGICYGMHILAQHLGGNVVSSETREYGLADVTTLGDNLLFPASAMTVWMSHGDRTETLPQGFISLAKSTNSPLCAMANVSQRIYGVQFHPEVRHTKLGKQLLENFVFKICEVKAQWTPQNIIDQAVHSIREQVGNHKVISAVSGGVDSSVSTALVHRAIGDQLSAVFIDTGLLRKNEVQQVETAFAKHIGLELQTIHARSDYFSALQGVTDPKKNAKSSAVCSSTYLKKRPNESAIQNSWYRAPFIRMWSNLPLQIAARHSELNLTIMWAGFPKICALNWWNHYATCLKMKFAR